MRKPPNAVERCGAFQRDDDVRPAERDEEVANAVHTGDPNRDDVGKKREGCSGSELDVKTVRWWHRVNRGRDCHVNWHTAVEQHDEHVGERADRDERRTRQAPVRGSHHRDAEQPDEVHRERRCRYHVAEQPKACADDQQWPEVESEGT